MTTANEVYTFILSCTQEDLARFQRAIQNRQEVFAERERANIYRGERVVTTGHLSPKYMVGLVGTVTKVNHGSAWVTFDSPLPGRFSRATELRIPISCIQPVSGWEAV